MFGKRFTAHKRGIFWSILDSERGLYVGEDFLNEKQAKNTARDLNKQHQKELKSPSEVY